MTFKDLAHYLQELEETTSRNSMVELLADLFAKTDAAEIDTVVYLLQGRVAPLYLPLEFGMADKMVVRAIAQAYQQDEKETQKELKRIGDLGKLAEYLAEKTDTNGKDGVSVEQVYLQLRQITQTNGEGSTEKKITLLADLLASLDPLSVRFVSRIPVGRMRLGFSDMTVLDALSWMLTKDKKNRKQIEACFNVHPDLGFIAKAVKEQGMAGLSNVKPEVFTPILMARAERLSSSEEIIEKIGKCAIEPKYDGFRLQAHFDGETVKLYTRNLEDATFMYPDVVEGVKSQLKANNIIVEGEAIAYDPDTGEYRPFQETVQRKRKYGIEEMAKAIPLKLICFDLLYLDGKSMLGLTYAERREQLARIISPDTSVILSQEKVVETAKEIEFEFDDAVTKGLEGIVAKRLDGVYQAGARSWNWIKFKRSYAGSLDDTIDAVVMGYYSGKGKRTEFGIGAFLIGIYDEKQDQYETIAKIGTGLTDEEWKELHARCQILKANEKPPLYRVDKNLEPDVWVEPEIVVEVRADEISRSPIHTAGIVMKKSKNGSALMVDVPGFALRFPRLERFRDDKKAEDTTHLQEIEDMFRAQGKKKVT